MKNVINTCVLAAGMILFSFVGTTNAAVVVTDSPFQNLGLLSVGQEDTLNIAKTKKKVAISQLSALLPSHSAITFTYNFDANLLGGVLGAGGYYDYIEGDEFLKMAAVGGDHHQGFASALSNTPLNFAASSVNGMQLDTALAYASADLDIKGNTATATIINSSGGLLDITSVLFAYLGSNKKYTISYNVTETPLPAALPMFALGLCAVAGIRKRKKAIA